MYYSGILQRYTTVVYYSNYSSTPIYTCTTAVKWFAYVGYPLASYTLQDEERNITPAVNSWEQSLNWPRSSLFFLLCDLPIQKKNTIIFKRCDILDVLLFFYFYPKQPRTRGKPSQLIPNASTMKNPKAGIDSNGAAREMWANLDRSIPGPDSELGPDSGWAQRSSGWFPVVPKFKVGTCRHVIWECGMPQLYLALGYQMRRLVATAEAWKRVVLNCNRPPPTIRVQ